MAHNKEIELTVGDVYIISVGGVPTCGSYANDENDSLENTYDEVANVISEYFPSMNPYWIIGTYDDNPACFPFEIVLK